MLKTSLLFITVSSITLCASAEDLSAVKAYDSLGRQNVTVKTKVVGTTGKTDWKYNTTWGSYDRDRTKSVNVEGLLIARKDILPKVKLEIWGAFQNLDKGEIEFQVMLAEPHDDRGSFEFVFQSVRNEQNYVYAGGKDNSGSKLVGWFVRAVIDGAIVGVAGSSSAFMELAKNPKKTSEASYSIAEG